MFRKTVLFWLIVGLCGCGKRTLSRLINHRMSPDLPYCQELPAPGPSQLHGLVEELDVPESHTGVLLLERGASALIARAWLVQNATERIDAQYFIFAADTAGLVAIDALLLAADRGVKVRLLVDDTLAHGDPNVMHALSASQCGGSNLQFNHQCGSHASAEAEQPVRELSASQSADAQQAVHCGWSGGHHGRPEHGQRVF